MLAGTPLQACQHKADDLTDANMQDLLNIARTTLSSKILTHDKDHFAELAVDAVLRLKGSTNLESINIIKKPGGTLRVSRQHSEAPSTYHDEALRACLLLQSTAR